MLNKYPTTKSVAEEREGDIGRESPGEYDDETAEEREQRGHEEYVPVALAHAVRVETRVVDHCRQRRVQCWWCYIRHTVSLTLSLSIQSLDRPNLFSSIFQFFLLLILLDSNSVR